MGTFSRQADLLTAALLLSLGASFGVAAGEPIEDDRRSPSPAEPGEGGPAELAEHLGTDFSKHETEHFVLVYAAEQSARAWRTARVLERAHSEFHGLMNRAGFEAEPLRDRLVWVYFENRDRFQDYALAEDRLDMSWSQGYYSARTNRVALLPERGPRGHHSVHSAGRGRAVDHPDAASAAPGGVGGEWTHEPAEAAINIERTRHEVAHQLAFNLGL